MKNSPQFSLLSIGFFISLLGLPLSESRADPTATPCVCPELPATEQTLDLASQIGALGLYAFERPGHAFEEVPIDQREKSITLLKHARNAKDGCVPRKKKPVSLYMRVSAGVGGTLTSNPLAIAGPGFSYYTEYAMLMDKVSQICNGGGFGYATYCVPGDTAKSLEAAVAGGFQVPVFDENFNLVNYTPEQLKMFTIYSQALRQPNAAATMDFLRAIKASLSVEEKIALVAFFGDRFADNYDYDRSGMKDGKGSGKVSADDILAAAKYNELNGNYVDPALLVGGVGSPLSNPASPYRRAGVCRDIALVQAQMLEALGLKALVRSYTVPGTMHVNVVAYDPARKGVVYNMNYSGLSMSTGSQGGKALYMGTNDQTIVYRLYRPDGKMVAEVPSEFGKILNEVAGFDLKDQDAMLRPTSSILAANLEGSNGTRQYRAFAGRDATNTDYLGLAYTRLSHLKGNFARKVGVAVGVQQKSIIDWETNDVTKKSFAFLYGGIEQYVNSPRAKLEKAGLEARLESMVGAYAMAGARTDGSGADYIPGNPTGDLDVKAKAGIRVNQGKALRDKFVSTYGAHIQSTLGVKDLSDFTGHVPIPVITQMLFTAEGRYELMKSEAGRAYLFAGTALALDYFGLRGKIDTGLAYRNMLVAVGAEGRITEDMPPLEEGVQRKISGSVMYRPKASVNLGLNVYKNIETDPTLNDGTSAMATFEWRH